MTIPEMNAAIEDLEDLLRQTRNFTARLILFGFDNPKTLGAIECIKGTLEALQSKRDKTKKKVNEDQL